MAAEMKLETDIQAVGWLGIAVSQVRKIRTWGTRLGARMRVDLPENLELAVTRPEYSLLVPEGRTNLAPGETRGHAPPKRSEKVRPGGARRQRRVTSELAVIRPDRVNVNLGHRELIGLGL